MNRAAAALLIAAAASGALEPKEVYDRAAPATVFLMSPQATGSGIILHVPKGLILTNGHVVEGFDTIEVHLKDGAKRTAEVVATDEKLDLALLRAKDLVGTGARALALHPAVTKADGLKATKVYAIGHPVDPTDKLSMWKFTHGIVSNVRALAVRELNGLVLIEHDATLAKGNSGGPLLDAEARLVGVNATMWAEFSGRSANTYYSIPVNAVHGFLAANGHKGLGKLPPDAMVIFDPSVLKAVPNQGPSTRLPRVPIPEELRYGPYVHTYVTREKRALSSRMTAIIGGLRGLFTACHTCKGQGSFRELVRAGYWADRDTWVEPVYRTIVCPTCEGDRKLFHATKGERVFARHTRPEKERRSGAYDVARDRFLRRLYATQRSFQTRTKVRIEVIGRYGIVHGAPNNPLFPLHFKLLPIGKKYEWFIHVDELNGPFRFGAETGHVPAESVVAEVAAADILLLPDGAIVRICGITVPISGGKVARPDLGTVDETARAIVRKELSGKTVTLTSDKYSRLTCDGHAIAFVELEGKDYGEELIRRGLVRRHPKHGHMRFARYKKAESEAKKANVGIWKD